MLGALRWMAATLDGRIEGRDAVFESKFMLPWAFSEEAAAEKYTPQLQHNMWVVAARPRSGRGCEQPTEDRRWWRLIELTVGCASDSEVAQSN